MIETKMYLCIYRFIFTKNEGSKSKTNAYVLLIILQRSLDYMHKILLR